MTSVFKTNTWIMQKQPRSKGNAIYPANCTHGLWGITISVHLLVHCTCRSVHLFQVHTIVIRRPLYHVIQVKPYFLQNINISGFCLDGFEHYLQRHSYED